MTFINSKDNYQALNSYNNKQCQIVYYSILTQRYFPSSQVCLLHLRTYLSHNAPQEEPPQLLPTPHIFLEGTTEPSIQLVYFHLTIMLGRNSLFANLSSTLDGKYLRWGISTFFYYAQFSQFSLVAQSCPTLCDPMNRSTPGLPVHHQLPEFTQTHVHRVSDAIQPSHPLSSPSPPAPTPPSSFLALNKYLLTSNPNSTFGT